LDKEQLKGVCVPKEITNKIEKVSLRDMPEEERLIAEEHDKLYQPNNQVIIDLAKIPNDIFPIYPKVFLNKAMEHLHSKGVTISKELPSVITELCLAFNSCINTQKKYAMTTSLVYPAQTGVGKSLCLQVYVSMLQEYSSLLVVPTVEAAIKYCKVINSLSGNEDYARTTYAVTGKNQKHNLRVEAYELQEYRAIIVTHSMFKKLNQQVDVDIYKFYNSQQRDLVVVDEKVTMYEQYKITYTEFDNLKNILESIFTNSQDALHIDPQKDTLTFLNTLKEYLDEREKEIITDKRALRLISFNDDEPMATDTNDPRLTRASCPIIAVYDRDVKKRMQAKGLDTQNTISTIKELLLLRIDELFSEIKEIGGLDNPAYKRQILRKALEPVDILEELLSDWSLLYKSNYGNALFVVRDILNKLGKNVVLDATATVNEFYKVANRAFGYLGIYKAKQIRKYANLTIHKAKGYKQTRYELYKKGSEYTKNIAEAYASYAASLLNSNDDKLLIICHKNFKQYLLEYCSDSRIKMTHWGDHVGKNDWSDCNKVMVVGWNYLHPLENISQIYSAAREIDLVCVYLNDDIIDDFRVTQVADDLVQAVMRSKARIMATDDSDCEPTEVYLFYNDDTMSNRILDIFEQQFPMAKTVEWTPKGTTLPIKSTKPTRKADAIITLLKEKETLQATYLLSELRTEIAMPRTTLKRIVDSNYFLHQLHTNGYNLQNKNGREKYFILK